MSVNTTSENPTALKCMRCNAPFVTGDLIHDVPEACGGYSVLCHACYEFVYIYLGGNMFPDSTIDPAHGDM